ncbi:FusB/FusC family EF-G-binding protein [Ammoniphilus sp. CFH 90114]|uniref:FusB/FusC family EF-G-binding protein n=1 Tax=Ammoniphilus sp. CFH 90114 TaxID=2493665 RepID=UPI00100FF7A2|nr:FusB/FusC family EF-G-binding protein [Ammoniphilus sp. CFH 90114]RXT05257.1 elongation factor G-binding protein [Ammoniphilus sp. CFH 90114]
MNEPFIRHHEYNFIKQQTKIMQRTMTTDPKVIEAVRYSAASKVVEMFPEVTGEQKQLLEKISTLKSTDQYQEYLDELAPYVVDFPKVTEKQIKKLFPKNKKLTIPDLSEVDHKSLTYLGWSDIATSKVFMVYPLNGEVVGVEGRFTMANKKDVCSLCKGYGEVALVTAISKAKSSQSIDYYKAVGNYMCIDHHKCNQSITDVTALERFIYSVMG